MRPYICRAFESLLPSQFLAPALCALLAACAVGPDFHTPAPPASDRYAPGQAPSAPVPVAAEWWRAFGSPEIDAMVQEALRANPDLKSADAALAQAREQFKAQQGALLPSVDAGYAAQRASSSAALSPVLADNSLLYSLHTAEVDVSYALDVFGGVRRSAEAARAQADGQRFQYEAARTALIANVVVAAVQRAALAQQLEAARNASASGAQVLAFIRRQVELGALGQADAAAQEATLAQAQQAVPPLEKALAQQESALTILLGREPGQGAPPGPALAGIALPADLPMVLPAGLVRQRPDIRAAEANLHAAGANVGVAIAARLPSLTLTASAGGASPALNTLLSHGDGFWSLSGGVTQPIFEGGALLHRQKAAEAALDQAKAQYRSTVLTALKNAADSLDALARDGEALKAAEAAATAADRSLAFSRRQLELGQVGALAERAAEQAGAQARLALAAAQAARLADAAALCQALGGGWSAPPS